MHLVLFFTYGVSLKTWAETGILQREIRVYQELMREHKVQISFLTYGDSTDRQFEGELKGIQILPVYERLNRPRSKVRRFLQTFFIPWKFRRELRQSDILKTNQMYGAWVPIIAKFLYKKKVILRCGYEWYRNTFERQHYDTPVQ